MAGQATSRQPPEHGEIHGLLHGGLCKTKPIPKVCWLGAGDLSCKTKPICRRAK